MPVHPLSALRQNPDGRSQDVPGRLAAGGGGVRYPQAPKRALRDAPLNRRLNSPLGFLPAGVIWLSYWTYPEQYL